MAKQEFNLNFGKYLRHRRLQKGWTQPELASKLGNNFQNISRMERGQITPSYFWVQELSTAFGEDLSEFSKGFEEFVRSNS